MKSIFGVIVIILVSMLSIYARAEDCNNNGFDDVIEIERGISKDCNQNRIPDECDLLPFIRIPEGGEFPTSDYPLSITSADFNKDGFTDIATVGSKISVLLNQGGGRFHAAVNYEITDIGRPQITSLDVENDGDYDLVITGRKNVFLMKNRGDGTFENAENIIQLEDPYWSVAHDFDNDGRTDLCIAHRVPESILILWNEGNGTFFSGPEIIVSAPTSLTVNDFDGDGDADLALGSNRSSIAIIRNRGNRKFSAAESFAVEYSRDIQSADFDRDGDIDLVTADWGMILVFWNNGSAAFTQGPKLSPLVSQWNFGLRVGHFNNDDRPDICLGGYNTFLGTNSVAVILNKEGGNFSSAVMYQAGKEPNDLVVSDFNNDTYTDLAIANIQSQNVSVLLCEGDGTFGAAINFHVGRFPQSVTARDLNNDGNLDLAVSNLTPDGKDEYKIVSVFLRNENLTLFDPKNYKVMGERGIVSSSDFNGDSFLDIAVACEGDWSGRGSGVSTLINQGRGVFADAVNYPVEKLSQDITALDIDNDNDNDLAVAHYNGISLLYNDGKGLLTDTKTLSLGGLAYSLVSQDFDADGDMDLAVVWGKTNLSFFWKEGDSLAREDFTVGKYLYSLASADLENDGDSDLAIADEEGDSALLLYNNGDRTFSLPRIISIAQDPVFLRAADFDQNGMIDLAASSWSENKVYILFQNQDGSFDAPKGYKTGLDDYFPSYLEISDFDENSYPDILAVKQYSASLILLRNLTLPPISFDRDNDSVPDECEESSFRRGDADASGEINISDAIFILAYLFLGGEFPSCQDAADSDDSGELNLTDAVFLLSWLFLGGNIPPQPGVDVCGQDTTSDALGCVEYTRC